ncbi:hypothetical protein J6590_033431 [Homalodisca vitripennis]|nr:hypothetical protein J6590_033431 [Homalodisca vitripennis]
MVTESCGVEINHRTELVPLYLSKCKQIVHAHAFHRHDSSTCRSVLLSIASADLERALNLNSLEERKDVQDAFMFLFKLVTSAIGSPSLLEPSALDPWSCLTGDLEANCTMERVQRLGNRIPNHLDFFSYSPNQFKTSLERFLLHGFE